MSAVEKRLREELGQLRVDTNMRASGAAHESNATKELNLLELPDFSLVLGGPLYQLLRRSHLEGDHLELL